MWIRLLGTAAGGGFPQWNCRCHNCRGVRAGTLDALPRTQLSVAISANQAQWFLINASPDIRVQIESFPALLPSTGTRSTGIAAVLLTCADLDHILGLMNIREGDPLVVYAPPAVQRAIVESAGLATVLNHYCGIEWREPHRELFDLRDRSGKFAGLRYSTFPVSGKPPRYVAQNDAAGPHAVGYRFVDPSTGGSVVCATGFAKLDAATLENMRECDLLLIDGTFWDEDEMSRAGVGTAMASEMGHCPIGGSAGSLGRIAALPAGKKVYVHINNTNPILIAGSAERRAVEEAGIIVGEDGMEFEV